MIYDLRQGNYTFKHSRSIEEPGEDSRRFHEHFHSLFELLYFIDGDAEFMIRHTLYKLQPHSLLVAKPGEPHQVRILSDTPYERMVVRFDVSDIPHSLSRRLKGLDSVYHIEGTRLSEELLRLDLHNELSGKEECLSACRWQLHLILTYLCDAHDLRQTADEVNEDIFRIIDFIDKNLTLIHTTDDLCTALHMSRSNLHKVFSSHFDTPIMSYIRTQKTTLAHALLNEGFPPTDIPDKCGFNDYSSFYRAYKKIYHTAPSAVGK